MDSDSSFDEDYELKHESEMKIQDNKVNDVCEQSNDSESHQEPEHALSDSNVCCDPVKKDKEGPLLNNSEIGSNCEDAWSNISSDCSKASALGADSNVKLDLEVDKNEEVQENKECRSLSSMYDERLKSHTSQGKDDTLDIPSHNEDFSCVSDSESNDGTASVNNLNDSMHNDDKNDSIISIGKRKDSNPVEEMEQLDFEAEEVQDKEEKEEGECEVKDERSDEGELEGDDLEEGELTDEDENRPEETEPRPICRFYSRGQCTWGSSCRFVHPGVTDKGNYTMFDVVRPLVPANGLSSYPPIDYRAVYDKPTTMMYPSPVKEEPVVFESAWERGLRQAKEMMRKSNQRKETDMDFEEKKMNLSLGQEELDKENDYYIRSASPVYKEEERWNMELDSYCYREDIGTLDHYDDLSELSYYPRNRSTGRDYWRRVHYEPESSRTIRLDSDYISSRRDRSSSSKYHPHHQHRQSSQEFYDKYEKKSSRQKSHPSRIVATEQQDKHRREDRYDVPLSNRRGDEWADPWMRSKSPVGRKSGNHVSRHRSNSSGSPRSSSGHSRSSSQSSSHSVSHSSRSRTQAKKSSYSQSSSRATSSHGRKPGRPLLPTPKTVEASPHQSLGTTTQRTLKHGTESREFGKNKPLPSSFIQSEKKAASERALLMNPPAPSPQRQREMQPHSPAMMRRSAQNPPPPASPARSNSSVSSSGSDSSGSTSDSSESSCSTSSSSREPSPKVVYPPKRMIMEERGRLALAAESLKVKAMDALKLSGQKQQIKLTLKTSSNIQNKSKTVAGLPDLPQLNLVRKDRVPVLVGKKRPSETVLNSDTNIANKLTSLPKPAPKNVTSRREELLKQLKAVEDAIARKRSKI